MMLSSQEKLEVLKKMGLMPKDDQQDYFAEYLRVVTEKAELVAKIRLFDLFLATCYNPRMNKERLRIAQKFREDFAPITEQIVLRKETVAGDEMIG